MNWKVLYGCFECLERVYKATGLAKVKRMIILGAKITSNRHVYIPDASNKSSIQSSRGETLHFFTGKKIFPFTEGSSNADSEADLDDDLETRGVGILFFASHTGQGSISLEIRQRALEILVAELNGPLRDTVLGYLQRRARTEADAQLRNTIDQALLQDPPPKMRISEPGDLISSSNVKVQTGVIHRDKDGLNAMTLEPRESTREGLIIGDGVVIPFADPSRLSDLDLCLKNVSTHSEKNVDTSPPPQTTDI